MFRIVRRKLVHCISSGLELSMRSLFIYLFTLTQKWENMQKLVSIPMKFWRLMEIARSHECDYPLIGAELMRM